MVKLAKRQLNVVSFSFFFFFDWNMEKASYLCFRGRTKSRTMRCFHTNSYFFFAHRFCWYQKCLIMKCVQNGMLIPFNILSKEKRNCLKENKKKNEDKMLKLIFRGIENITSSSHIESCSVQIWYFNTFYGLCVCVKMYIY